MVFRRMCLRIQRRTMQDRLIIRIRIRNGRNTVVAAVVEAIQRYQSARVQRVTRQRILPKTRMDSRRVRCSRSRMGLLRLRSRI